MGECMGDRVRGARRALGMTQEEAAAEAGISAVTLSDIENDPEYDPHMSTLMRVATAVQLDLDTMIRGESPK